MAPEPQGPICSQDHKGFVSLAALLTPLQHLNQFGSNGLGFSEEGTEESRLNSKKGSLVGIGKLAQDVSGFRTLRCIAVGLMEGICRGPYCRAGIERRQRHPRSLRYGDLRILACPPLRALQMPTWDGLNPSAHGMS